MRKKLIALAIISCLLVGCGKEKVEGDLTTYSKDELIDYIGQIEDEYYSLSDSYDDLQNIYNAFAKDSEPRESIGYVGNGSEQLTFNSLNNKVVFPSSLNYPNSSSVVPEGKIKISKNVTCSPASNWVFRLNNASLELEHSSSGISGTIQVSYSDDLINSEDIKSEVIEPWLDGIPSSDELHNNIYIDKEQSGCNTSVITTVDSEPAVLRCGVMDFYGDNVIYVFMYKGERDSSKEEIITSLINSITISGGKVVTE